MYLWTSSGIRSLLRGFTCPGFTCPWFQGSLVQRFTCLGVHLSVLFVCYNFLVRVRHFKGPPLPGCAIRFYIRTFHSLYGDASQYYTAGKQCNTFYSRSASLCYTANQSINQSFIKYIRLTKTQSNLQASVKN